MKNKPFSIALIRGKYANNYELQNYQPLVKNVKINAFTSLFPLEPPSGIPYTKLASYADIPINQRVTKFISNRTLGDMHVLFGLENALKKYNILHTADPYYYFSFQAAQVKKRNPEKLLVSTVWETIPFNNEKTTQKKAIKKFVTGMTDLFITYSQRSFDALLAEGVSEKKITLLHLGIDTERFKPHADRKKELLFVGRLVPEKNPEILLKSFAEFFKSHPEYTLIFVGTGPLYSRLTQLISAYGLEKSVRIEHARYEHMPEYYRNCEMVILPSRSTATWEEQYGMVLLEAMASGTPVISTDCGAIPEVLDKAGLIVPQNNREALTSALNRLSIDANMRRKLGTIGRDRAVTKFNRNLFAQELLNTYEKSFSRHSR